LEVKVSREAGRELEEAAAWYENEQPGLGERLIEAFGHATQLLEEPNPPLVPVEGEAGQLGAKQLILHRFPFSLVTIQDKDTITVIAFAHHARKPAYWRQRL